MEGGVSELRWERAGEGAAGANGLWWGLRGLVSRAEAGAGGGAGQGVGKLQGRVYPGSHEL